MSQLLHQTRAIFPPKESWKLILLLVTMVVAAVMEMVGVGLVMPFIALLERPEVITEQPVLQRIYTFSGAASYQQFLLMLSGALILFYLVKNLFLGWITYWQSAFLAVSEAEVSTKLLTKYLAMPYVRFTQRNTAELVNNITVETTLLFAGLVKPVFFILSDAFVTVAIMALLLYIEPLATICAVGVTVGSVVVFYYLLRGPLKYLGASRQHHREKMIQWVNQSLGSVKEITVLGRTRFFEDRFRAHAEGMIHTQTFYETVTQLPRMVIESFGVIVLMVILMVMVQTGGNFISTLSLFAMAAFRLMPSINRAAACATKVRYYTKTLNNLYRDLEMETKASDSSGKNVRFTKDIVLKDIVFSYPGCTHRVLDGLQLTVHKGTSVGIVGPSGEGKSTLVDILLGLLPPQEGCVLVDGVDIRENLSDWHKHISYMPQTVYLTDDTVRRNVALGVPDAEINEEKVWQALEKAQLAEFIRTLPEGLEANVGEQGTRLSGGQRQRIGIARALYNEPDVLILDEATTALDPQTETKICQTLQTIAHDITIIAISHQPALIAIADTVYRLTEGKVVERVEAH